MSLPSELLTHSLANKYQEQMHMQKWIISQTIESFFFAQNVLQSHNI